LRWKIKEVKRNASEIGFNILNLVSKNYRVFEIVLVDKDRVVMRCLRRVRKEIMR